MQGKPLNAIAYGTLTSHLTRTLNALGLKREPIDVTPVLNEYLDTCRRRLSLQISSRSRALMRAKTDPDGSALGLHRGDGIVIARIPKHTNDLGAEFGGALSAYPLTDN